MADMKDSFDQTFIDDSKKRLEDEKASLEKQLHGMTGEKTFDKDKVQVKWSEMGDKDEDNAVEVAQFQDSISLERSLEENLEKVDNALERIQKGTYGICEVCQGAIEEDRLTVNPQAIQCMKDAVKK